MNEPEYPVRSRPLVALAAIVATAASMSIAAAPASATIAPVTAAAMPSSGITAPMNAVIEPTKRMPTDVPSKKTPWVADGEVTKVMEIGDTMVAGGLFTTVQDPMNGTSYTRQNLFTWDKATGLVNQSCNPTVDGQIQQLLPGPTPNTVYVAGDFTKINGKGPNHIQLIDVTTCQAVTSFKAPATNGGIATMEMLPNNRLFIGGFYTKIAGVAHGELAVLNATTGALDPTYMDIDVAGHHNNTGSGAQSPIGIRESGVTPDGSKLVVIGNFRTMAGVTRNQIAMIDLGPTAGTLSTTWNTTQYAVVCSQNAFDSYMRDVEMSPDGSFFVVATTGGPHSGTLCDTAARWETNAAGTTLTPTWVANSGGDTLWGVGISDAAVFVGGHNRWINNPNGADSAGQASVPRPGLSALDPQTGVPLKWNPGRNPRGEAAYDIYDTTTGVWVVSDTDWIGDRRYQRKRIAYFPYDTGYNIASTTAATLPGNVYIGSPNSNTQVLYRVNAGGSAIAAVDTGNPDWTADTTAAPSPFHNAGSSVTNQSALTAASLVNVPATTPLGIWTQERNDGTAAPEMQWSFPVAAGTPTQVRLYFASRSSSPRTFNVLIDGVSKLAAYNPNVDPGVNKGTMKSFDITSDGTVNIDFGHLGSPSPLINAIEILNTTPIPPNATAARVIDFDGTAINSQNLTTTANFDWTNVRGAVMVGRSLFYGLMTGTNTGGLYKRTFDGSAFGDPVLLNPYQDPLWNTVLTGSGPSTQTYNGVLPTWYTSTTAGITQTTGMFYWKGRLYYTKTGQNNLYWRWFVPDSGIVGGVENTLNTTAAPGFTWSNARGMFVNGTNLYVVSATDGSLNRINFANGTTSGTSTVVNSKATGGIDWRGRGLFLSSVLPNVSPTANFAYTCAGLDCTFSNTSNDSDGSVVSYDWDFGDGEGDGSESPAHTFPATGTYNVTLDVTDDQDASATVTKQVSVEKPNEAPTAAYTVSCTYLDCTFTSTSTDSDGTVQDWAWDFGDGDTDSGAEVNHVFDSPGDYVVSLTATDDDNATDDVTTSITVTGAPVATTVNFVGSAVNQGNVTTPNVTTPAATSVGDTLVMILTLNSNTRVLSTPTGITGWTLRDTRTAGTMASYVYTKNAEAGDANKKVTITLDLAAKYTMTVGVYSGVRAVPLVTGASETVNRAAHATPTVNAPAGAFVVSYWADKSSLTTGFVLPSGVTGRSAMCSTGTAHVCSTFADSAGAVPTGQYGGLTATADTANLTATMYTIVLRTQEPNIPPTAAFSQTCDSLGCSFDAVTSSDVDGNVASYAWDFGDNETGTGVSPSHTFPATGTYHVVLTVTDNENGTGTVAADISVTRTNADPVAAFSQTCTFLDCMFDSSGSSDSDGTIVEYLWDFGDTFTSTDANPVHGFSGTGSYQVSLTVTDNDAAQTTFTTTVNVVAKEPIAFVGAADNSGNVITPNAPMPAGLAAGDRLFVIFNVNANNRVLSNPTGVTGWNLLATTVSGGMATTVYTKVAVAADAGKTVRVPMDAAAKYTMSVVAYSGDIIVPTFEAAAETVSGTSHTTPTSTAPEGAWVLSAWADKSSATTGFTLPGGVTQRSALCAPAAGRVCSAIADSGAPVAAGPVGGLIATADSSQASATMWTIVIRPAV
jgi:PKD repeat protein